jgi:hypothetical protein
MASLHDATLAVVAGLSAAINDNRVDIADHPGRFTQAELQLLARKKRAVRVAIESMPELVINGPGQIMASPLFSAVVICSDVADMPRHQSALDLVQTILQALPHARWGASYLGPVMPKSIRADNLYSGDIDSQGIALWGISWQQKFSTQ